MTDPVRGSGYTKKQMLEAPNGAVYVWCNNNLFYPQKLAEFLERKNLEIVTPSWVMNDCWQGRELTGIVVDHACYDNMHLRDQFWSKLQYARLRVRVNPNTVGT